MESAMSLPKLSIRMVIVASLALLAIASAFTSLAPLRAADGDKKDRYFEMRTYYAAEGKLDALNARFRDHTNKLFVKHGITPVGYWVPFDGPESKNTLVYILAYPSREAREVSWKAFAADPEWKAAKEASETQGKLVDKVEFKFLSPTDYSAIK